MTDSAAVLEEICGLAQEVDAGAMGPNGFYLHVTEILRREGFDPTWNEDAEYPQERIV